MSEDDRPICFVVMGFGKKTDYESGRTLDLDKTYHSIIKPAALASGMRPIRSDEIWQSAVIDVAMYEMLLRAELVIADISTSNPNAIYELGVRHALRPKSTIVMKEQDGKYFFDLNHEATFSYKHLGEDIGFTEANRAQRDLEELIRAVINSGGIDSPVYTYIPKLVAPKLSDEQFSRIVDSAEEKQEKFAGLVRDGEKLIDDGKFGEAYKCFERAHDLRPTEPYVVQRMVLARYKNPTPSELSALTEALVLVESLNPSESNDPETLGLSGAIYKRIWLITGDAPQLDKAIASYGRGFDVRRDYYNGENLALCHDYKAKIEGLGEEEVFNRLSARKVREQIRNILLGQLEESDFSERSDYKWVMATLASVFQGLGDAQGANKYRQKFMEAKPAHWEVDSFERTRSELHDLGYEVL